jgi:hypothetical protein
MRQISVFAFCALYFIFSTFFTLNAEALKVDSKFIGKAGMVLILTAVGTATKLLIHRDHKKLEAIHNQLSKPDRIVQIQRGFDVWTIEYYDGKRYVFKNGIFQKAE